MFYVEVAMRGLRLEAVKMSECMLRSRLIKEI